MMRGTPDREPIDADELAEIRERADAALEGPWTATGPWYGGMGTEPYSAVEIAGHGQLTKRMDHPEAVFIAHAREDIPRLLDYVTGLETAARCFVKLYDNEIAGIADEMSWTQIETSNEYFYDVEAARALLFGSQENNE